jgi:uncharacterized membrane protein YGL010W
MSGVTSRDEWIVRYEHSHQHPVNRACHTVGIPMIVLAVLLGAVSIFVPRLRVPALVMFALGWVLQFIGHAFEGKAPEFFKDWRFLFVGVRWWLMMITGRV